MHPPTHHHHHHHLLQPTMDSHPDPLTYKMTLQIFSNLEHKWLNSTYNNHVLDTKKAAARILTIDGGGTTGSVSGTFLIHLESQIQSRTGDSTTRISDFFDVVAGTGIGALYAAMLTADDGTGRPLYSAKEAVAFLTENRPSLFKPKSSARALLGRIMTWKPSTTHSCFSGKSMDGVLRSAFTRKEDRKVLTLRDTCKPLLVPCFDLNSSAPFVFSRAGAAESPSLDFELWRVCRGTASTPSMLRPFEVRSVDGKTACLAVDGGLVMNNPAAAAVTHVMHNKRDFPWVNGVEDLVVLSLGNGQKGIGGVGRGECSTEKVMEIVMDGVSETVDQMLGNAFCWNRTDYVRIQAYAIGSPDVLNERVVESLPFGRKRLLPETNGQRIENFVQRLIAIGKTSLPPSPCKAVSPLIDGR